MKTLLGVLLILAGIALGIYVGVWLMLVGGIISLIDGVTAEPVNSSYIAWGIIRVIFASVVGWFVSTLFFIPGLLFLAADE